jgi:hypothetical protein
MEEGAEPAISLAGYDFVDFGCSAGGSIHFAMNKLGGKRGLGLDIKPKKIARSRAKGYEAELADVSTLDVDAIGTVRFVVMAHFLEHLPTLDTAVRCIRSAVHIADEFVFIRQPYFDADGYLAEAGLQPYWSNWAGHMNHMNRGDFIGILSGMKAQGSIGRYILFARTRVLDSADTVIHPMGSDMGQHHWDAELHPPKPFVHFSIPVYREIGAVVQTRSSDVDARVEQFLATCDILFDSAVG